LGETAYILEYFVRRKHILAAVINQAHKYIFTPKINECLMGEGKALFFN